MLVSLTCHDYYKDELKIYVNKSFFIYIHKITKQIFAYIHIPSSDNKETNPIHLVTYIGRYITGDHTTHTYYMVGQ